MFLRGLSGALTPTGQTLLDIKDLDTKPVDMSPLICGKKAKAYIKQRMAAFPMGLKGKPSYLNDKIEGPTYIATELGAPSTTPIAPGATATATGDGGPDAGTDD